MKVVDMFGCRLPVLAKRFEAIGELILESQTGITFDSPIELKHALIELAMGFPNYAQVNLLLKIKDKKVFFKFVFYITFFIFDYSMNGF